ncbi:hypothetical protein JCM12107_20990 [Corynebacterium simulans]
MCVKNGAREPSDPGQNCIVSKDTVVIFYAKFASKVDDNKFPANGIGDHIFAG